MDRLDTMAAFVAVVESGSFTAAGRKLGVPLPTLSRAIAALETHLGSRLLKRSTRRLDLTPAGQDYVAACKRILEDTRAAERKAAGEYVAPKGDLVVTAPLVFGRLHVVPIVAAFLAAYPEIDIRLVLSDRNIQLLDDHIDLAVRIGALPDSALSAIQVGTVRRVVCGSPAYFAAHGVPQKPEDLAASACVTFDSFSPAAAWSFGQGRRGMTVPIRARLSVNTAEAALDAAIAGAGVTQVLSYQAAAAVAAGKLRIVLASFEAAPVPVTLLHPGQGLLPLKTRSFIAFAAPRLKASIAAHRDALSSPPKGPRKTGKK